MILVVTILLFFQLAAPDEWHEDLSPGSVTVTIVTINYAYAAAMVTQFVLTRLLIFMQSVCY